MRLKKVIAAALVCCSLCIPVGISNAFTYPKYLNGDTNIELGYGQAGGGTYIDKSSVVCEYYNPPYYRLAANIVSYNFNDNLLYPAKIIHIDYHIDTGAIYITYNDTNKIYGPYYDRENLPSSKIRPIKLAKLIWKTAYNMNWKW